MLKKKSHLAWSPRYLSRLGKLFRNHPLQIFIVKYRQFKKNSSFRVIIEMTADFLFKFLEWNKASLLWHLFVVLKHGFCYVNETHTTIWGLTIFSFHTKALSKSRQISLGQDYLSHHYFISKSSNIQHMLIELMRALKKETKISNEQDQ